MPDRFVGAWRRTELRVDGAVVAPADDADVLWLQAGHWYADLRIPRTDDGGPVEAFAGPARWEDPSFTWVHELDWVATFPSDEGTFEDDGDDLVEQGSFVDGGRLVPYEERWTRTARATDFLVARSASAGPGAVLVEVGPHRLLLADGRPAGGGFTAVRSERSVDGWRTVFRRGPAIEGEAAVPARTDVALGAEIALGAWTLTVTELSSIGPRRRDG